MDKSEFYEFAMSNCQVLCMLTILIALLSITSLHGGPVKSFASVMASRTAKIPRAIRAPFRNNEMMTARGFGKRSQMIKLKEENILKSDSDIPWPIDKFEAQDGAADNNDLSQKSFNSQFDESIPIDWIIQETLGNEDFLRSLLERYVDTNHDGQVTLREFFNDVTSPIVNDII